MTIKCIGDKKEPKESLYVPHKLRSRPLRCITLPLCCLFLFIIYWFVLCPLIYVSIRNKCAATTNCKLSEKWPWYFWIIALVLFIVLLSIVLCVWCCKPKKKASKQTEERQKEYHKLLKESFEYDSVKETKNMRREIKNTNETKKTNEVTIKTNEKTIKINEETKKINEETMKTNEKTKKILEERPRSIIVKNPTFRPSRIKQEEVKEKQSDPTETVPKKTIDEMFPRCSVRRKDTNRLKQRPESLVLQSPKYPKQTPDRHTVQEEVRPLSPLTPREIFFYDLFKSAHLQMLEKTAKFLENEKKHSSNNFYNPHKPEITDFVLKQQSSVEASSPGSPEFFIANISPQKLSCTSEVFMYVEGGQSEEALTICYLDKDDMASP